MMVLSNGEKKDEGLSAIGALREVETSVAASSKHIAGPRANSTEEKRQGEEARLTWLYNLHHKFGFGKKLCIPWCGLGVLNILIMLLLVAFFIYNAYNIVVAYQRSQDDPPATQKAVNGASSIRFPYTMVCSSLKGVQMEVLFTPFFLPTFANCTDCTAEGPSYVKEHKNKSCVLFDLRAAPPVTPGTERAASLLGLVVDLNTEKAGTSDFFFGIEIYMNHEYDNGGRSIEDTPSSFFLESEGMVIASAGVFTDVSLRQARFKLYKKPTFYQYTTSTGNAVINPNSLIGSGPRNLSSLVFVGVRFGTTLEVEVSSAPQVFKNYF